MTATHGRIATYNAGCRCPLCKAKNAERTANYRTDRFLALDDPRHGTPNAYNNFGCRCDQCVPAYATYQAQRAAKKRQAS